MTDQTLFAFGTFIFALLGLGVGFTVAEFRSMARSSEVRAEQSAQSLPRSG